jgi:arginine deiminase
MPLGAYSEVGRLCRVMVHRPGLEHSRLTPSRPTPRICYSTMCWGSAGPKSGA